MGKTKATPVVRYEPSPTKAERIDSVYDYLFSLGA